MFKLTIVVIISLFSFNHLFSQTKSDTISVEYSFWGNSYFINGNELSKSAVRGILGTNPVSQDLISSSSTKKTWGYIVLSAGLLYTAYYCYDLYQYLEYGGNSMNYNYHNYAYKKSDETSKYLIKGAVAVGIDLIGLYLLYDSNVTFKKALRKYNQSIGKTTSYENELKIFLGYNRINLAYHF